MASASGRLSGTAGVVAASVLLAGCGGATQATERTTSLPSPRGQLVLEFDEGLSAEGDPMARVQSSGTATLRVSVSTAHGGTLDRVAGRSGYAVRTPAFSATGRTPAAVLVVKARGADQLSPGERPFRWGVDVLLDAEQGTTAADNGDNVLQRGLFDDRAQVKLQLDGDVPSCRVRGDVGEAMVTADRPVERETWHRLACQLRHGELTLLVGQPGLPHPEEWSVPADVGAIEFRRSEPIAIGGKVDRRGRIQPKDTDQFNGLVDNVFMDIS
ncbi:hypothetical protein [Nocardioides solisilvae]|uniref:hypothetical protein n=1 Tax=Nocardioides solisilvae TaxID=1542435 RepID=UPI0013A53204|nr:hypothetical protein [Nocardioides solisilvae]